MRMNEVEVFRFYRLFVRIDSVFHPNLLQCPTSSVSFGVNTPSDAHLGGQKMPEVYPQGHETIPKLPIPQYPTLLCLTGWWYTYHYLPL